MLVIGFSFLKAAERYDKTYIFKNYTPKVKIKYNNRLIKHAFQPVCKITCNEGTGKRSRKSSAHECQLIKSP